MSNSSQNYIYTTKASIQNTNTRLLWRGSLVNQTGSRLHGLAIVAHSMNPKAASQAKRDPFSADSYSNTLKDTCLEIEMLRGRDLQVVKPVQIVQERSDDVGSGLKDGIGENIGSRKSRVASLLKGKGNGLYDTNSDREILLSEIDCDPQVRLYLDPRCTQTHTWILSQIAKKEINKAGITGHALIVRLDTAADDQISPQLVIFARAVDGNSVQSSTSDATIPLQLVIGQRKPPRSQLIARPDDPMPRVVPSLLFTNSKKNGLNNTSHAIPGSSRSLLNLTSGKKLGEKIQVNRQDVPNSTKRNLKAIKRPANTPGRRIKPETSIQGEEMDEDTRWPDDLKGLSPRRSEKRKSTTTSSYSTKKVKTVPKPTRHSSQFLDARGSMEETWSAKEGGGIESENGFPVDRSPSPSPSPFRYQPTPDQSLSLDTHKPPVPLVDTSESSRPSKVRFVSPSNLSPNLRNGPSLTTTTTTTLKEKPSVDQLPSTKQDLPSYLHQNKTLIRKITTESLNNRGLDKHQSNFKDLFTAVCRGVQFALRETLDKKLVDVHLTRTFVESHLAMYMIYNNNQ